MNDGRRAALGIGQRLRAADLLVEIADLLLEIAELLVFVGAEVAPFGFGEIGERAHSHDGICARLL